MFISEGQFQGKYGNNEQRKNVSEALGQVQLERAIRDFLYPTHDQLVSALNDLPYTELQTPSFLNPRARILGLKEVALSPLNSQVDTGKVLTEVRDRRVVAVDSLDVITRGIHIDAKFNRKAAALVRKYMITCSDPESSASWLRMTEELSSQFGLVFEEVFVDTKVASLSMKAGKQRYHYSYHQLSDRLHGGETTEPVVLKSDVPSQLSTTDYLNIVSDLVLNCPSFFALD